MKPTKALWVLIAVEMFLIGTLFGSFTITGVNPDLSPHGAIEYWINRYQTLLAGTAAIVSATFVIAQLKQQQMVHRANIRLALKNDFDALNSAKEIGQIAASSEIRDARSLANIVVFGSPRISDLSTDYYDYATSNNPPEISALLRTLEYHIGCFNIEAGSTPAVMYPDDSNDVLQPLMKAVNDAGSNVLAAVERREAYLAQFIPN